MRKQKSQEDIIYGNGNFTPSCRHELQLTEKISKDKLLEIKGHLEKNLVYGDAMSFHQAQIQFNKYEKFGGQLSFDTIQRRVLREYVIENAW